ncbi:MAG: hypothetical protein AB3N33_00620 [Puniceicoccaceae bacterium]
MRKPLATAILGLLSVLMGCNSSLEPPVRMDNRPAGVEANLIIGTHAIGGPYQLTDQPYLLEVARELDSMGSSILKFTAGPHYTRRPYHMEKVAGIRSLADLFERHPVYREVLSMGFRDYFFWASPFGKVRWQDGLDVQEEKILYAEMRELAEYLLTRFNGTGKVFHVGHWEGDWLLLPSRNPKENPAPERLNGFVQYLNVRQSAIEDARNSVPHAGVSIYHYAEVNLVMKGLDGSRPTLTNTVLPRVDVDYVSYSSYDTIQGDGMREKVVRALDHIESMMKPRPGWTGKRVYAGEFAIRASLVGFDPEEHDRCNREVISAFLEWGCPYILYWQMYCNEPVPDLPQGYNGFWLIDPEGTRYPLYYTMKDYWQATRMFIEERKAATGKLPTDTEIREFAIDYFKS